MSSTEGAAPSQEPDLATPGDSASTPPSDGGQDPALSPKKGVLRRTGPNPVIRRDTCSDEIRWGKSGGHYPGFDELD